MSEDREHTERLTDEEFDVLRHTRFGELPARVRRRTWSRRQKKRIPPTRSRSGLRCAGSGASSSSPRSDDWTWAEDDPATAPILVTADGYATRFRCDVKTAFLVPEAARLPFPPCGTGTTGCLPGLARCDDGCARSAAGEGDVAVEWVIGLATSGAGC